MFDIPAEYLVPYTILNNLAVLLVLTALWRPRLVRFAFALFLVAASTVSAYTVLTDPLVFMDYADFAMLDAYRAFIEGPLFDYTLPIVLGIALYQLLCGVLLLVGGTAARLGALGGAIFFAAIAPMGVAAAFPFSVTCILALIVMDWRLRHPTDQDMKRDERRQRQSRAPVAGSVSG
jgi:hypothetical protein